MAAERRQDNPETRRLMEEINRSGAVPMTPERLAEIQSRYSHVKLDLAENGSVIIKPVADIVIDRQRKQKGFPVKRVVAGLAALIGAGGIKVAADAGAFERPEDQSSPIINPPAEAGTSPQQSSTATLEGSTVTVTPQATEAPTATATEATAYRSVESLGLTERSAVIADNQGNLLVAVDAESADRSVVINPAFNPEYEREEYPDPQAAAQRLIRNMVAVAQANGAYVQNNQVTLSLKDGRTLIWSTQAGVIFRVVDEAGLLYDQAANSVSYDFAVENGSLVIITSDVPMLYSPNGLGGVLDTGVALVTNPQFLGTDHERAVPFDYPRPDAESELYRNLWTVSNILANLFTVSR